MDDAAARVGHIRLAAKDYLWGQNENGPMIQRRKKEAAPCSLNGADTASFKLVQNYILTQFILHSRIDIPYSLVHVPEIPLQGEYRPLLTIYNS